MQLLLYTGIFLFLGGRPVTGFTDQGKPRVIVLTDIENEPDDAQSLVRSLTYVNQFEVEGIIATTSIWLRNQTAEWRIHEILEAYREVQPNLEKHETGYPTYNELKGKTKAGIPLYGMNGVGEGKDSEGSDWIIMNLKKDDPRPLWVLAWGGPNCLAQALWKLEQTESSEDLKQYIRKLRVYTISDQDDSGPMAMGSHTAGPITERWEIRCTGWTWTIQLCQKPVSLPRNWVIPKHCILSWP